LLGAEQVRKYALAMVGVVNEQQQVTEADQCISTLAGYAERVGPAMYIAYHVHPHPPTVGKSGSQA
jgi:hypothetical protein